MINRQPRLLSSVKEEDDIYCRQKLPIEYPAAKRRSLGKNQNHKSSYESKKGNKTSEEEEKQEMTEDEVEEESSSSSSSSSSDNTYRKISRLNIGSRVAYEFADGIYFGSIVSSISKGKRKSPTMLEGGRWEVEFDDGDCWELDYNDVGQANALFQKVKEEEMKDQLRYEKTDRIIDAYFKRKYTVLNALPHEVKDQFLQVGFAKWNNVFLPVLFLGPYDLSPGPVRDKWMKVFDKAAEDQQKNAKYP